MAWGAAETVVDASEFQVGIADASIQHPDQSASLGTPGPRLVSIMPYMIFETNGSHIVDTLIMLAELVCFEQKCGARFPITEPIYNCPSCGALFEVRLTGDRPDPQKWKKTWRGRRTAEHIPDHSGVWPYRQPLPFSH